jgi:murein endopeptidase
MAAVAQVAGQEYPQLARRQVNPVAANQSDDRVTQDTDQLIRIRTGYSHFSSFHTGAKTKRWRGPPTV